ncbi:MAG TPA: glycosyltransferase family 4 protein [Mariprofundaceae bacterium]|nr:glycosyltransferase family 4 protein [Mariprofundaceae bacterium]
MKVAYVSQFSDFVGGGEYSLLDLATHLPAGVEAVLVTPAEGALARRAAAAGVRAEYLPLPPVGWQTLGALSSWRRWLKAERPDVVHANNSRAAFYAGLACRGLGIPVLFHCRVPERDPVMDRLLRRLVGAVIANSAATARRFASWSGQRVHTIYNGLDVSQPLPCGAPPFGARQVVLVVGRLSDVKRQHRLVELFPDICGGRQDVHLLLAGGIDPFDPAYAERLQALIAQSPCAGRMHWLGEVADIAGLYACATVVVLPSRFESFGRVLVEAMGAGVPVVAFRNGGIPEVVEDGKQGMLLEEGDWDGMVVAVRQLLADDGLRRHLGEAGRARVGNFSLQHHVQAVMQLYGEMMHAD